MHYWLLKSEPDVFSITDLEKRPKQIEPWEGVRNYQARNFLKEMKKGDLALFYHSSCKEIGIAGLCTIVKEAYPDPSAKEKDRWVMVDVKWKETFINIISLEKLKKEPMLKNSRLIQKGNRLSVIPLSEDEFNCILALKT